MEDEPTYTAFVEDRRIAAGSLTSLLPALKTRLDEGRSELVLIFDDRTGHQVDFDARAAAPPPRPRTGPGRPKLGVVSREVSLLPRHWEWLEQQPNGASAALRRLIDQERRREPATERLRQATEATGRFLAAMAGNFPNYEEATRALWAADRPRFDNLIRDWPADIRAYANRLLDAA
ncbi:MAG TPA: DUF2239 family protein [Bryobacteraceae bacterium]|nr:DUF2239 family protein [Bryobacteraceae bacterium]